MEKDIYTIHADFCKVFTNRARLEILDQLRDGEKSVSELAKAIGLNQPNVSQHLAILREKKIVLTRKMGNVIYYSITNRGLYKALDIVRDMICDQLIQDSAIAKKAKKSTRGK